MLNIYKAASVAAISATLVSAAIYAGPGFASGLGQKDAAITADMIQIDPGAIASDQDKLKLAKSDKVTTKIGDNGDIIFVPGNGIAPDMAASSNDSDEAEDAPVNAASLSDLVRSIDVADELTSEEHCLAGAVYFESKGESLAGQLAVARVVMARAKSGRFPTTLCGVVFQKSQFSFVRGGRMPSINTGSVHWRNAKAIAHIARKDSWKSPVEGALFFHARYVSPGWRLTRLGTIDNHIFYR